MSETKKFHLPDLGEGLPDAEIVGWHVKVGDIIRLDEPLVSMETAKAVVDVLEPVDVEEQDGDAVALTHRPREGLTEEVDDKGIASTLRHDDCSAQECVDTLIAAALDGGGSDNVTAILVRCH